MSAPIGPEAVCSTEARAIIRDEAIKLIRRPGFKRDEIDDLAQEITARAIGKLTLFDPSRAPLAAFLRVVARTAAAMIARERRAEKRGATRGHLSTDAEIGNGGRGSLGTHLAPSDAMRRLGIDPRRQIDSAAVRAVISTLHPDLAQLCTLLQHHSVAETARLLGIRRQRVYEVMPQIRQIFLDAGLDEYF